MRNYSTLLPKSRKKKLVLFFITHEKLKFLGNESLNKTLKFFDLVDHKSLDFRGFSRPQTPLGKGKIFKLLI